MKFRIPLIASNSLALIALATASVLPAQAAPDQPGTKAMVFKQAPNLKGIGDLETLNDQLVAIAPKVTAATVALISRGGNGGGSGVIVDKSGLILTAAHVVASLTDEIIVILPDGSRKEAKKLGANFDRDSAMVQITQEGEYPFVELGSSADLMVNQWCLATGHPGGFDPLRTPPLRLGRILAPGEFLVTDSVVVGGDSGGPLFDTQGRLIGIHSNIGASLSSNRHVPVDIFQTEWDSLKKGERKGSKFANVPGMPDPKAKAPSMGAAFGEPSDEGGVILKAVRKNSPAEKAGLRAGDAITSLNGKAASSKAQLLGLLGRFAPGDTVKVEYRRDGETRKTEVQLAKADDTKKNRAPADAEGKDALDKYLDENMDGKTGKIELRLTNEMLESFGGMEKLQERIRQRMEKLKAEKAPGGESPAEGDSPESADDAKAGDMEDPFTKKLREMFVGSLGSGTPLKLTPDIVEEAGGMDELQKKLAAIAGSLTPEQLAKLRKAPGNQLPDPFYQSSLDALKTVMEQAGDCAVAVMADGKPAALGTIVSADGLILTKDSETAAGKLTVMIGDTVEDASVIKRFPEHDLALLKVRRSGLTPVKWAEDSGQLPPGSLLTARKPDGSPLGIGLVSVKTRPMKAAGFLGIAAEDSDRGVRVAQTVENSPARKAGLKDGDIITEIDGEKTGESSAFVRIVGRKGEGETVKLRVLREGEEKEFSVTLASREASIKTPDDKRMAPLNGPMSKRRNGFPRALQHDIPIKPSECGGPLLDLAGRCIGINVSRAGRIQTLAIPAEDIVPLLESAKSGIPASDTSESDAAGRDEKLKKVIGEMREMRKRLEELEKELAPMVTE
jgi:serine protease Do